MPTIDAGPNLTAATAAQLRAAVAAALGELAGGDTSRAEPVSLRLLLIDVTVFDLTGLRLLVGLHRQARYVDARIVYVDPPAPLLAAMRRHGLHRVLSVEINVPGDSLARGEAVRRSGNNPTT